MAILKPDKINTFNGVTVNEYLLTAHNTNKIAIPSASMDGKVIGVTIHNTDWINVVSGTTPSEQYTRATVNGNMGDVRVHYYVDDKCAWQNLPLTLSGWHAADGDSDGNRKTIAIECIMSSAYNDRDKKSEDNAARLAAYLLKKYGFGIDRLYTHNHWYSKKYCPAYILPHWNAFREKVESYMGINTTTNTIPTVLYRIRKSWDDIKGQIGAYSNLESAKKACPIGYYVFDNKGNKVYSPITVNESVPSLVNIQNGARGQLVKGLQCLLNNKGYNLTADGIFGDNTTKAVKDWQSKNGLAVDGICGTNTWVSLLKK